MARNNKDRSLNVLAIRFSAIGDVAMTVPVLSSVCRAYPQHKFTMLTNSRFEAFFQSMPDNFCFMGVDLYKDYKGSEGLKRLVELLKSMDFDMVADLHGVIRTHTITMKLRLAGCRTATIRKGRIARWALTRQHFKRQRPLKLSIEKYQSVLERLGFDFCMDFSAGAGNVPELLGQVEEKLGQKGQDAWVGIAPFAAHKGKIYPLELMEKVVADLDSRSGVRVFIFAYGKEKEQIADWPEKYGSVVLVGGMFNMHQEMALMSRLDVMLSMDSSNMHIASLCGTRVVSVWGATHPNAGFLGVGQKVQDCVQLPLACRPCSIYGKKACRFGDYRCLSGIAPEAILKTIGPLKDKD
ncbi:MAG: glycosyltransferase family 9 protein [Bacteroidaceae bacterium]|nr:glycosyltransferase family 9 protein [Bacteroidaceae bacterium]